MGIYSNNIHDDGYKICNTAFTIEATGNPAVDKFFSTFNGIEGLLLKKLMKYYQR